MTLIGKLLYSADRLRRSEKVRTAIAAEVIRACARADDFGEEISEELSSDYPHQALEWIKSVPWQGPQRVELDDVDYSNSRSWRASEDDDKVDKFTKRIISGWEKPVLLIRRPGADKLMVVDGHHRALAYLRAGRPLLAYVGQAPQKQGPWDTFHDSQRSHDEKQKSREVAEMAAARRAK